MYIHVYIIIVIYYATKENRTVISEHFKPKHEFVTYSQIFFFQHAAGSGGGGQQLMSSGSCLERFNPTRI